MRERESRTASEQRLAAPRSYSREYLALATSLYSKEPAWSSKRWCCRISTPRTRWRVISRAVTRTRRTSGRTRGGAPSSTSAAVAGGAGPGGAPARHQARRRVSRLGRGGGARVVSRRRAQHGLLPAERRGGRGGPRCA